ncbi:YCF48-related protein [Hymenobacter sp. CRA2]|uniref:YCF48-related protein n=1 Tax=Hymenobacter sp. CRA2 TaxID=1955620 RepID=UPI00098F5C35|nr:YCF48-related protein [Hymenobacter sp. CRA2]OON65675.1 hypothetical protein B0919_23660 [Hymenobacter sp. CRA2]
MRKLVLLFLSCLGSGVPTLAQWQRVTDPVTVRNYDFAKVEPVNAQTAWFAYGTRGAGARISNVEVYRTQDGGRSWQNSSPALTSGPYHWLHELRAVDQQVAWAVVSSSATSGVAATNNQLLSTTDGGATWVSRTLPTPDFAAGRLSMHFFDPTEGVLFSQNARALYRTTDGGLSWQSIATLPALPLAGTYDKIEFYESGSVLTLYSQPADSPTLTHWISTDHGLTWRLLQLNNAPLTGFPVFRDARHALLGQAGQVWASADAGQSWTPATLPPFLAYTGFSPVPGTTAYVAGASSLPDNSTTTKGSAISYDDGRTWTLLENSNTFASIRFAAPDAAWGLQATFDPLGSEFYFGSLSRYNGTALAVRGRALSAGPLQAYPNPSANGRFALQLPTTGLRIRSVRVLDALGRVVYQASSLPADQRLDLSQQPKGLYSLTIQTNEGLLRCPLLKN